MHPPCLCLYGKDCASQQSCELHRQVPGCAQAPDPQKMCLSLYILPTTQEASDDTQGFV